jgi:two-component system CheB/CheR fusion protein
MDPPFTKLDIVSCRNLLIYLSPELQKKLILLFHYCLSPGGILFLGSAETAGACTDRFKPISRKLRIFRRTEAVLRQEVEFPASFGSLSPAGARATPLPKPHLSLQALAEQLVLQCYAPPALLVDDKGNILYVSGRTGKYLEPAAGKANWNIFAMARAGLRNELNTAFHRVLDEELSVVVRGLNVGTDGGRHHVDITVRRIEEPESLRGLVMVVFTDVPVALSSPSPDRREKSEKARPGNGRLEELERKYQRARLELQSAHEEMQTTQEELRSANEEMQSTNEELQSTNEQLTTSKEEMQSLNEELQTVNAELQGKVDELLRSDNDMKNLLNSTDIATVFLDNDLHVRRFTTQATKIIKLIPGDVGRPITDLASDLLYSEMTKDARAVLRNLDFTEKSIATRDGRWFTVRIMPYRTLDDRIDGVVITFSDITAGKTVETQLRKQHDILEQHVAGQSTKAEKAKIRISTKHFSG